MDKEGNTITDTLITKALPYVTETIWLGKDSQMIMRLKINGHGDVKTMQMARKLMDSQTNVYIADLYSRHKDNPHIKWKDSIKKVVGLEVPTESGLDI